MWHRACSDIERIRMQLRAAGADHAACAHAAREGAGVLSAWSLALEGERPGPLARAARLLASSAELPAHAQQRAGRQGARASGLALFMLAVGEPDSAFGWMLVARELHRAREIETELDRQLEQVRAMLESERPSPTPLDSETATALETRQALPRTSTGAGSPTRERWAVRGRQAADRPAARTKVKGAVGSEKVEAIEQRHLCSW